MDRPVTKGRRSPRKRDWAGLTLIVAIIAVVVPLAEGRLEHHPPPPPIEPKALSANDVFVATNARESVGAQLLVLNDIEGAPRTILWIGAALDGTPEKRISFWSEDTCESGEGYTKQGHTYVVLMNPAIGSLARVTTPAYPSSVRYRVHLNDGQTLAVSPRLPNEEEAYHAPAVDRILNRCAHGSFKVRTQVGGSPTFVEAVFQMNRTEIQAFRRKLIEECRREPHSVPCKILEDTNIACRRTPHSYGCPSLIGRGLMLELITRP
jgi:hypothetical protein